MEPDAKKAIQWWPDIRNNWTRVSWPECAFGFTVFHNGVVITELGGSRWPEFEGLGAQYTVSFCELDRREYAPPTVRDKDSCRQGWSDGPVPVLWTEWNLGSLYGVVVRQYLFPHLPGESLPSRGIEACFGWFRMEVHHVYPSVPIEPVLHFLLKVDAPHIRDLPEYVYDLSMAPYPRPLQLLGFPDNTGRTLVERDGRVRMGILPSEEVRTEWVPPVENAVFAGGYLQVRMPVVQGNRVDFLLTVRPMPVEEYRKEAALGFEGALSKCRNFWSGYLGLSRARMETPEPLTCGVVRHGPRNTMMNLAALRYGVGWPAQTVQVLFMNLDMMGFHSLADRYLEVFRRYQGIGNEPTSPCLTAHPGYLALPCLPKGSWVLGGKDHWMCHHGVVLWAACSHALLTGDEDFIRRWTDPVLKACEFIRYGRSVKGHGGVEGVMPAAVGTDWEAAGRCGILQRVWTDGWMYKGLTSAVRFLSRTGHPRAEEFAGEAKEYRDTFVTALRKRTQDYPAWKTRDGRKYPFVPPALSGDQPFESRWEIYLDCGPLFLVFAGLFDADDPLMEAARAWFREGPPTWYPIREDTTWHMPILLHEMGTGEAAFSWNIFHSLYLGDRRRYLEGMYSLAAGSISRQTFTAVEERHMMRGLNLNLQVYALRLAVLEESGEDLHLLKMAPLAWFRGRKGLVLENMPTEFGPVSLEAKMRQKGEVLDVRWSSSFRRKPRRIHLHIPPARHLQTLVLNGEPVDCPGRKFVVLP